MKKFLFSGIIACLIGFCLSCTTTEDSVGLQMRAGLPNFNYKIQKNEPVSVVFLGGSITNHQGYRVQITCLLYTSPSPRDISGSRMPSSA